MTKAYDIDLDLTFRAVIHCNSKEEARELANTLADRFSEASQCLDGSAYGVSQATEFSANWEPNNPIDIEFAYDDDDLESDCRTDGCDGDPDAGDGFNGFCGNCADRHDDQAEQRSEELEA